LEKILPRTRKVVEITDEEATRRWRHRARLVDAYGAYFADFQWDHWCTLTSANRLRGDALANAFSTLVRSVNGRVQRSIPWLYVLEPHASGSLHLHAFLYGTEGLPVDWIRQCWKPGTATVEVYNRHKAAAFYTAKAIDQNFDLDWNRSKHQPPRVENGRGIS
jgi:hypothetical protein